jgi:Mg2+ and Co2+ transporter CorA
VQHEHTVHTADELASKKINAISKELHNDMNEIDETLQYLSRKMIHKIKKQNKMIKFLKSLDRDLITVLEQLGMLEPEYDASNHLEFDSDSSSDDEIDTLRPYEEYDELPPIENGGFLACRKHL